MQDYVLNKKLLRYRYRLRCFERVANSGGNFDDSDTDDEFEVDIGPGVPSNETMANINEDRSTHFVAIQVRCPDIKDKALQIQQTVVDHDEYLVRISL